MPRGVVIPWLLLSVAFSSLAHAEEPYPEGQFSGNVRTYAMGTINRGELQDWASWALGGKLSYHSPSYFGVGAGATVYSSNSILSNADELDSVTGRPSRYELGLFNVEQPEVKEIAYLGEAYLDFASGKQKLWIGRHLLKTPMFNPQDGRMIPTLAQGAWYSGRWPIGLSAQAGYIGWVAPRNTGGFVSIEDSMGLYPSGRNTDGSPAEYAGNTESKGLFIGALGFSSVLIDGNVWDYFTENVFNLLYSDVYLKPKFWGLSWSFGVQHILEHQLADGGSSSVEQAYFQDERAQAFGGQLKAVTRDNWTLSASYNRITTEGRFLFPREWGREPLFVFQKRERSEGTGDLHAGLLELQKDWTFDNENKLSPKLGAGVYMHPDAAEPELNKYAFPSYYQASADVFYHFGGALKGMALEVLLTYKGQVEGEADNPNFVLNKVDMLNTNVILNYAF